MKSHLSTLCWGEGRNLRDRYLKISADKSKSCTLDSTFIIQGNRTIKPQNWNVSSIHLPLWKYTFGHGSHLHHSSRVNSFRMPDLHQFPLDGNKHLWLEINWTIPSLAKPLITLSLLYISDCEICKVLSESKLKPDVTQNHQYTVETIQKREGTVKSTRQVRVRVKILQCLFFSLRSKK